jgi:hypothetical protein
MAMQTEATERPEPAEIDPAEHRRSLRRAAMLTAGVGVIHAVLFLLSYWLLSDAPGPKSTDQEFVDYYSGEGNRRVVIVGLYLMPFAGIAFVWFIVALRMWISGSVRRENVLFSNIQLVTGIIYVALFFVAAAAESVVAASVEFSDNPIDPTTARQFPQLGSAVLFVFAMRMAAMFVIMTSNIGRVAGILPRWFAYAGFLVGLFLLLSATFNPAFVLVFPVWILVLCAFLIKRAREIPSDIPIPPLPDQLGPRPIPWKPEDV